MSELNREILLRTDLAPENTLQRGHILRTEGDISAELCYGSLVLMLPDVELGLGLVVFQLVAVQLRIMPLHRQNIVGEVSGIDFLI